MLNRVLITGGTGTLGHALVPELLKMRGVERITIFSRDEQKQYEMAQLFAEHKDRLAFFVGDVRDYERLASAMERQNTCIHAAALKIVPKCEFDPFETIKTNILGSQNVIRAALASPFVARTMLISTDKAVNPANLYGATKLAAERLFIAAQNLRWDKRQMFSVCRYGNVTGSRGSVLGVWEKELAAGQPLSITSPDMRRFWITPTEAVRFVLRRLEQMEGAEIFVPRMPTYNIIDLAGAFVRLKGKPHDYGAYNNIGLRPGEKIYEDMISIHEAPFTEYWKGGYDEAYYIRPLGDYRKRAMVADGFSYDSRDTSLVLESPALEDRLVEFV